MEERKYLNHLHKAYIYLALASAGHRDTSVTSGIYGHVFEESKKKAAKTIGRMFADRVEV